MVRVPFEVPPAVRVTDAGVTEQLPVAFPPAGLTTQLRPTAPAKPLIELTVKTSVLPEVAPEGSV